MAADLLMSDCLSVLVAAHNEERTIAHMLRRLLSIPVNLHEVIVVDDGSTDDTARIAEEITLFDPRVRLLRQPRNLGKTAAIRRALAEVTGDIVIIQDADLEYDPHEIPDVVAPIVAGLADVVYGSRFMVRRAARVLYYYHYLANRALTCFSNLLTNRNMTDIETCYKAFRASVIKPIPLTSSGFGMEVEITALVCNTMARTYEIPISYYGRTYEEGKKIAFKDGIHALWYIFYYNLIAPRRASVRRYITQVDTALAALNRGPIGSLGNGQPTPPDSAAGSQVASARE